MRGRHRSLLIIIILITISIGLPLIDNIAYGFSSRSSSFEIEISDNEGLLKEADDQGWNGTGTPNDPVIIENISYDLELSNRDAGISLKDISLHLVIQNITIRSGEYGIRCDSVANLSINGVTMIECEYGIHIYNGKNISIIGSNFSGGNYGLNLRESVSINISGSRMFETSTGIRFENNTKDITVSDCEIRDSYQGTIISNCEDFEFRSTVMSKCENYGFYIYSSSNIIFKECFFERANSTSVQIKGSSNSYFINCTFLNIRGYPIEVQWDSSDIYLENCDIIDNQSPIRIYFSSGTILFRDCNFRGSSDFIDINNIGEMMIKDCYFESNGHGGVRISKCEYLELTNNDFNGSGISLYRDLIVSDFIITGNKVNGEDLIFLHDIDLTGSKITGNAGQIILFEVEGLEISNIDWEFVYKGITAVNCSNITIKNISFNTGNNGLHYSKSKNMVIDHCQFRDLAYGAIFNWGDGLQVINCSFLNINGPALSISHIDKMVVKNNVMDGTDIGMSINGIEIGEVTDNHLQSGKMGIEFRGSSSSGAMILNNTIKNFPEGGMILSADGYFIWENHLINCSFGIGTLYDSFDLGLSENNTVNGLPIEYEYRGRMVEDGKQEKGQYIAVDCELVSLCNITMNSISHGVMIAFSDRIDIWNCTFREMTKEGMHILHGGVLNIFNNTFVDSECGLKITKDYLWDMELSAHPNKLVMKK